MAIFVQDRSVLSGIPRATIEQWLTEAQTAYMQLMVGQRVVTVSYEGKSTTFEAANITKLQEWIALLQQALGINRGRRAMRFIYAR